MTPAQGQTAPLHVTPREKNRIQVGISWDTGQEMVKKGLIFKKEEMVNVVFDIDLFCCVYDADGTVIDHVTPDNAGLMDASGQIYHSGDNQTGRIGGDDEFISVNTATLPDNYHAVVFFALCQSKRPFSQINNATIRVADGHSDQNQLELAMENMPQAAKNGLIFAAILRDSAAPSGWGLKNISVFKNDGDVSDWGAEGAAFLR